MTAPRPKYLALAAFFVAVAVLLAYTRGGEFTSGWNGMFPATPSEYPLPRYPEDGALVDIRYPDKAWSKMLLQMMKEGPLTLPKDFDSGLPPPPANDSKATRDDLDAMLRMQATERTPETVAAIKLENQPPNPCWFFTEKGLMDRHDYEKFTLVFYVVRDVSYFLLRDKYKYERARPTQLEPKLTTVVPIPAHGSYPCGHCGQSWAAALALAAVDPPHADAYKNRAMEVGYHREVAGLHYPGDAEAGRLLATNVFDALMKTDRIKQLFQRAVVEQRDDDEPHWWSRL